MGREAGSGKGSVMTSADNPGRGPIDGEVLRLARTHLELTQTELAERLGVSPRTIVNWEANGVPAHRLPRVERRIGPAIRAAADTDRSARMAPAETVPTAASPSPEDSREKLLRSFTDLDLLIELQARSLRREAERAR